MSSTDKLINLRCDKKIMPVIFKEERYEVINIVEFRTNHHSEEKFIGIVTLKGER